MREKSPRVSVVMPVYNGEQYLHEAVASILAQTFNDFEFIVVDDGSSDSTREILQEFASRDSRMHIISRPNTGIVGALNDGLAAARGEIVARMDADDVARPERFAKQFAFLEAHPNCVGVGSAVMMVDMDNDPVREVSWTKSPEKIHAELLTGKGGLAHPTAMLRREFVEKVGGYRFETQYAEDLDLWLRLSEHGQLANLPEVLLNYRMHAGSICANYSQKCAARRAVSDAKTRRGLAVDVAESQLPEPDLSVIASFVGAPVRLIVNATLGGYPQTARKHARGYLTGSPLSLAAWGAFLMTHSGPFARIIVRIGIRLRDSIEHGVLCDFMRKFRQVAYFSGSSNLTSGDDANDRPCKEQGDCVLTHWPSRTFSR